jgi:hypothetical protein
MCALNLLFSRRQDYAITTSLVSNIFVRLRNNEAGQTLSVVICVRLNRSAASQTYHKQTQTRVLVPTIK